MSKEQNQDLIAKAKQYLKLYGYDVKTSHLYEVFSKLADETNWHVASSKKTNLLNRLMSKIKVKKTNDDLIKDYLELLGSGALKDRFFYGFSLNNYDPIIANPEKDSGALFAGRAGSGKTLAMRTSVLTNLIVNGEESLTILFDAAKGFEDFKDIINLKDNVATYINKKDKFSKIVDALYSEMEARQETFVKAGVSNTNEYNESVNENEKLSKIILAIEELPYISDYIDFNNESEIEGTSSWKLKIVCRIGRSYGVQILMASQMSVIKSLSPGLANIMSFSLRDDNLKKDNLIELESMNPDSRWPGKCMMKSGGNKLGEVQFPHMSDEIIKLLIPAIVPCKYKLLSTTLKKLQNL